MGIFKKTYKQLTDSYTEMVDDVKNITTQKDIKKEIEAEEIGTSLSRKKSFLLGSAVSSLILLDCIVCFVQGSSKKGFMLLVVFSILFISTAALGVKIIQAGENPLDVIPHLFENLQNKKHKK